MYAVTSLGIEHKLGEGYIMSSCACSFTNPSETSAAGPLCWLPFFVRLQNSPKRGDTSTLTGCSKGLLTQGFQPGRWPTPVRVVKGSEGK